MSSDAKSILGTIYKVCLSWIYHSLKKRSGGWGGGGVDGERSKLGPLADQYLDRDMRSLEQRGNEGWGERWDGSTCGSILGSGCWVVLAVLGHSLVELSSTLGVRLKNRRPLFTVKNWVADLKKKLARLCRRAAQHVIYTIGTQVFTVKNVEDAHGSSNTLVVKSRPVVRRIKILGYASIHLWWSLESGSAD